MATVFTAHCTRPDGCGWTGGPYRSEVDAWYRLTQHSCGKHERRTQQQANGAARRAAVDRTPKPCHHKQADHQHGTHAAYSLDRCRCTPCSRANAAYERTRVRQTAYGRWQPYVPAGRARLHVLQLMRAGVGLKRITAVSGVSAGVLHKLVYGLGGKAPSRTIRPATEAKLLAVRPDQHADGAKVLALGTARRLQALACLGWSVQRLADHAGIDRQPLDHALTGDPTTTAVLRRTRDTVSALYDQLWQTPAPADDQRSRISVSRARTRALQAGWLPPLAWDDIDDPTEGATLDEENDVAPQHRARVARTTALIEDAAELASHGETWPAAAARLDVTVETLRTALKRHDRHDVADRFTRNDPAWRDPRITITTKDANRVLRHMTPGAIPDVRPKLAARVPSRRTA